MFCSQCGAKGDGNFCSQCGSRLATLSPPPIVDWSGIYEYEVLLSIPQVRDRVALAANQAQKRMTGEEFLALCDTALKPIFKVPLSTVAKIAQPIYAKLGIRTGKIRSYVYSQPIGTILVEVLCSLARNGQKLQDVQQSEDGCLLKASIPSDMFSFEGEMVITVRKQVAGTVLEAATAIKGQLFDWGKSNRCLDQLFTTLRHVA